MKQFATILFLVIALFNLGAYRILTNYLQNRVNQELELSLNDRQYSEEDLISIKSPLQLPYYASSAFERVSGELTIKGVVYKYVKRRVQNDTLELLCIRDRQGTGLLQAKEEFYKQSNGLSAQSKKPGSPGIGKPVFFDYCNRADHFTFGFQLMVATNYPPFYPFSTAVRSGRLVEQPPEA